MSPLNDLVPPLSGSIAIFPALPLFYSKTQAQLEKPLTRVPFHLGQRLTVSVTVGGLIGAQMIVQPIVEKALYDGHSKSLTSHLASSAIVGALSSPIIAIFNGLTDRQWPWTSLRRFSPRIAAAITVQETLFVAGMSAAAPLANRIKESVGDYKVIAYASAALGAAAGSIAGHPANTALTVWQGNPTFKGFPRPFLGLRHRTLGVIVFSFLYTLNKEWLSHISQIKSW